MPPSFVDPDSDSVLDSILSPLPLKTKSASRQDSTASLRALPSRRPIADVLHQQRTSGWGKTHFDACNAVVNKTEYAILPGLKPGDDEEDIAWPHWGRRNLSDRHHPFWSKFEDARQQLHALVSGPPDGLATVASASLLCRHLQSDVGFVWAALRKLRTLNQDSEVTEDTNQDTAEDNTKDFLPSDSKSPLAKRVRRQTSLYAGMVPYARGDLSDPHDSQSTVSPAKSLGGHFPSTPEEPAFIPQSEDRPSFQKPESLTAEYIYAFIRHALQWLPPQHEMPNDQESTVDLDIVPTRRSVNLQGPLAFASIDDGGLYLGSVGCVAIIEMKRSLGQINDGAAKVPDAWIAQIVGESLAVRLQDGAWAGPPETVFVIAPARHYVRLFELIITDRYLTEFKNDARGIGTLRESLKIHQTKLFDLSESQGCLDFLRNLSRIVKVARDIAIPSSEPTDMN